MSKPLCTSCKHHIYIARDGAAICRHVEKEDISPYKWACIWCGDISCQYYQPRKQGDKKHLGANDKAAKTSFKGGQRQ